MGDKTTERKERWLWIWQRHDHLVLQIKVVSTQLSPNCRLAGDTV
jgi:hypothetical protein